MLQFLLTLTDESNHGKVEQLYKKYHDYFMKCAVTKFKSLGRTNCVFDAEDAVQNTFMKITRYIDNIDFSRGEQDVRNYCLSILSNEICNVLSENQENFEVNEEFCSQEEYNFIEELGMQENYAKVVKAIEGLDDKYSTTLQLYFCKEMTVNEIAEMMGISAKTVYTRLARGKKLLLDILKGAEFNG